MTPSETALSYFRTPPFRYNCAQAICEAFGRRDLIPAMRAFGEGLAPNGTCGALYAATVILPEAAEEMERLFHEIMGATCCQKVKEAHHRPCVHCVKTAADLLNQYLKPE